MDSAVSSSWDDNVISGNRAPNTCGDTCVVLLRTGVVSLSDKSADPADEIEVGVCGSGWAYVSATWG